MSLTLKVEQMLVGAGLVVFFDDHPAQWHAAAKKTHTFIVSQFPSGATIRRDDIALALVPVLEVHEGLSAFLQEKKLTQKYWIRHFADLIVDRAWASIIQ
jgi:hypothetical protein